MESARLSTLSKEALALQALHARVSGARDKIPGVCLKIGQMWRKAPCFGLPVDLEVVLIRIQPYFAVKYSEIILIRFYK